eukprot:5686629-Amphidinium_carterae.2
MHIERYDISGEKNKSRWTSRRTRSTCREQRNQKRDNKQRRENQDQEEREVEVLSVKAKPTAAPSEQATSPAATSSTEPPKPTRQPPIRKGQFEETLQEKTPKRPSKPILNPRLRLEKNNFHVKLNKKPDLNYENMLLQEMIQRSYIKFHLTTCSSHLLPQSYTRNTSFLRWVRHLQLRRQVPPTTTNGEQ